MAEKDLNIYLTGVAADGNAQTNPNASLGGKRSGTILRSLSSPAPANITGVTVVDVSANCGAGNATLAFTLTGQTLAFTAPGDTAGTAVAVGVSGTYEVYSGTASKYIIVSVVSASLPGSNKSDTIALTNLIDNFFDSVSSAEAVAGSTEYRALMVKNDSANTMYGAVVWLAQNTPFPNDEIWVAIEAPAANAIQSIANETTAPTGLTWSLAASEGAALSIGNLAAGACYGIWLKRIVSASANRYAANNFMLTVKADTV